jgi:hypothetical protein
MILKKLNLKILSKLIHRHNNNNKTNHNNNSNNNKTNKTLIITRSN